MEITLKINDIISEEEIREIAIISIKDRIYSMSTAELDRVISNWSYYESYAVVDKLFTGSDAEKIRKKTELILEDLSSYVVFREKTFYQKESDAYGIMRQAVLESRDKIREMVDSVIINYPYSEKLDGDCLGILHDSIIRKLEKKES